MVEPVSTAAFLGAAGIGALGSIAGSFMSGKSASKASKRAAEVAIWQQLQNQNWSEYMSNTAHQREVEDLKAAGLNPVLSANGGAATTGGGVGNAAPYESYDYSQTAKTAAEFAQKAMEFKALKNATDQTEADTQLKGQQKEQAKAETDLNKTLNATKEIERQILEANKDAIIEANNAKATADKAEAKIRKTTAEYDEDNMNNPLFKGVKAFSDISSMALGPVGQIFGMVTNGMKAGALKKMANKKEALKTVEEIYDGKGKLKHTKVNHYNN